MKRRGREGWNGVSSVTSFFYSRMAAREREKERGGRRGREEKRKRESGGFLDDFLITRSQSRVSARHKRHFARTVGRQLARETRGWHGDACRNDPGFMLSLVGESRGTRTVYTCMRKPNWRKRAKGTWRSFQPIYIYTGREKTLFRREFSPHYPRNPLPSWVSRITELRVYRYT